MRARTLSALVSAAVLLLATEGASACPRDGTSGPCHCLMRMMATHPDMSISQAIAAIPPSLPDLIQASTQQVHVFDFDYSTSPAGQPIMDATVNVGDTVHWVWDTGFHDVQSVIGSIESFNSAVVGPGSTFDHTFTHAGVYHYYCTIHGFDAGNGTAGGMAGTITVLAPEPGAALAMLALIPLMARRRAR